jgi:hypothetical protein
LRKGCPEGGYVNKVSYQGFIIEAVPHQLAESKEWTLNINIFKDTGSQTTVRPFSTRNTFDTKEEAIQHCFNFGRQIIDGKIPNCTVKDL